MNTISKLKHSMRLLGMALLLGLAPSAASAAVNSGNASLNRLEIKVNGNNIVSGFNPSVKSYDITVDALPVTATLSAAPAASDATVDFTVNGTTLSNHSVAPLTEGGSTITCKVASGQASAIYTVKISAPVIETGRTVHFKGGWSATPYVYAYSATSPVKEYFGAWPGTQMSADTNGWYTIALPDEADKTAMVIFNTSTGSDRYPSAEQPGIKLDFDGNHGWFLLSDKKWYTSNPEGPKKPAITVTPASGRVRGTSTITINIANEATSITGSFNGHTLTLSNGANSLSVSDYLADGQEGTLTVSASNELGTSQFEAKFNRDDTVIVVSGLTGDWRELSIYQIMVGSFMHSDLGATGYSQMWGPEGHRKNGNLRGIIESLDYIKDLGMNAIWLTPIFDSSNGGNGDERLKATGYFANDYFKIDPHFGTEADFRELVDEAHARGIYIILDGVFGHHSNCTGASPNGNYIDNRTASNVRGSDSGNISYPGSLDYFKEVVRYWMDNFGVDGWRLDQCYQVYQGGHNYWYDLRLEVEAVAAERKNRGEQWGTLGYMVGEDWTSAGNITVTQQDGLKSVMDFDGKDKIVNLSSGVATIGEFLSNDAAARGYRDEGVNPTLFLSNHDTSRVGDFVDINSSPERLMTRHAAVAAYSGPTCTYYGDEIGDKSGNGNADNKARTSGRISGFNSNEQLVHDYVAKVFKARAENPALWRGSVSRQQMGDGVEIITKTDAETGNTVICIFSQQDTSVSIGGTGEDLLNGGTVSGTVSVSAWVPAFIRMN